MQNTIKQRFDLQYMAHIMNTTYRHTKQVTRMLARCSQGVAKVYPRCSQALGRLMSMLRVCLEYAYTYRTGGQTPCAMASHTCFSRGNTPFLQEKHCVSLGETLRSSVWAHSKELLLTLLLLITGGLFPCVMKAHCTILVAMGMIKTTLRKIFTYVRQNRKMIGFGTILLALHTIQIPTQKCLS